MHRGLRGSCLVAAAALLAAIAAPAEALEIPVDTTNPLLPDTVGEALDLALPGDTITLPAGTFSETVVVDVDNITIRGAGQALTIINGSGVSAFEIIADDVTVEDLTITGDVNEAVIVGDVARPKFEDVTVRDANNTGIKFIAGTDAWLDRVSILDNGGNGLRVEGNERFKATWSNFEGNFRGAHILDVSDLHFTNNTFGTHPEHCLVVENGLSKSDLHYNDFSDCSIAMWIIGAETPRITFNELNDILVSGILVHGSTDVLVDDNDLTAIDGNGVTLSQVSRGLVIDNNFEDTGRAMHAFDSEYLTLAWNTANNTNGFDGMVIERSQVIESNNNSLTGGGIGMWVIDGADVWIWDNQIVDMLVPGLIIENTDRAQVLRNIVNSVGGTGIKIVNVEIAEVNENTVTSAGRGIYVLDSLQTDLAGNQISDSAEHSMVVELSDDIEVLNHSLSGGGFGLWILNTNDISANDNLIEGTAGHGLIIGASTQAEALRNILINAGNTGVLIEQSSDALIQENNITGAGRGIWTLYASNVLIDSNSVSNSSDNGMVIQYSDAIKVFNNTMSIGGIGIWFIGHPDQGNQNEIGYNDISGYNLSGLSISTGASDVYAYDNTIYDNYRGIKIHTGGPEEGELDNNTLEDNTVTGNDYNIWYGNLGNNNVLVGGLVTAATVCDFWDYLDVEGEQNLVVTGTNFGSGANASNQSSLDLSNTVGNLTNCFEDPDPPEPPVYGDDACVDGKPSILTLQYTGDGDDATTHSQTPEAVVVIGDPENAGTVFIIASNKADLDNKKAYIWFNDEVLLNDEFDLDAANDPASNGKLGAKTFVWIYDEEGGELLQHVEFHSSCSLPLFTGDQFGSLLVTDFVGGGP